MIIYYFWNEIIWICNYRCKSDSEVNENGCIEADLQTELFKGSCNDFTYARIKFKCIGKVTIVCIGIHLIYLNSGPGINLFNKDISNHVLDETSSSTIIASIACVLVVSLVVILIILKSIAMKKAESKWQDTVGNLRFQLILFFHISTTIVIT